MKGPRRERNVWASVFLPFILYGLLAWCFMISGGVIAYKALSKPVPSHIVKKGCVISIHLRSDPPGYFSCPE